jgi:DegV family protein with EDD domain
LKYKIIADSCSDLDVKLKKELYASDTIPFFINIDGETFVDDNNLNIHTLLAKMKACKTKMTTACPSPETFKDAFIKAGKSFAITISSKLSGSFSSAQIGGMMAKEEKEDTEVYVIDSKSAVCGEVLVASKIRQMLDAGELAHVVKEKVEEFIENMHTFFVLNDISNLVKSGRMSKLAGKITSILGIKPLLGAKDGEIELFGKVKWKENIADKLLDMVSSCGRIINGDELVISHCNNLSLAKELKHKAKQRFNFGKIRTVATRGLSSSYACDKGIVMAF